MASLFEHSELAPRLNGHRPIDFSHVSNNNEEILDLCVRRIKKEKDFSVLISQSAMECSSESSSPVMVSPRGSEASDTFQQMHMINRPHSPFQLPPSPPMMHVNTSPFQSPPPPITQQQTNSLQVPVIVTSVPNIPITAPPSMIITHPPPTSLLQQQLQQPPNYINSFRPRQPHEDSPTTDVGLVGIQSSSPYNPITQVLTGNNRTNKPTRPFKAYPKDPLSLAAGVSAAEALLGCTSNDAYVEFRRKMLDQIRLASNGGKASSKNGMVKRSLSPQQPTSTENEDTSGKDAAYWERRRKNNEAAKRSRDARRAKEDEIAIRAAFLEQENLKLKYEVAALRSETTKLRCMLYNS